MGGASANSRSSPHRKGEPEKHKPVYPASVILPNEAQSYPYNKEDRHTPIGKRKHGKTENKEPHPKCVERPIDTGIEM
jgi:hypothetical protein